MGKVSWVILTYNRADKVERAITHSKNNAGYPIEEIIHVDNGSKTDDVRRIMRELGATTYIYHPINLGVARGYNSGLRMARGDFIVITGCDRLMPDNWLKDWIDCFQKIPHTGIIASYSWPIERVAERYRGQKKATNVNGINIVEAMPMEARILKRSLFNEIGYMHEGFGLYGLEDLHWGERAEIICKQKKLLCYILPGPTCEHLGLQGCDDYDGSDEKTYHNFKQKECKEPWKEQLLQKLRREKMPKYDPYS